MKLLIQQNGLFPTPKDGFEMWAWVQTLDTAEERAAAVQAMVMLTNLIVQAKEQDSIEWGEMVVQLRSK